MARSRRACPERSRGNPDGAYRAHAARSFRPPKPETGSRCRTHLMALAQCLPPAEPVLIPTAHAELVQDRDIFAIRPKRINRLLGVIRVLRFPAVLHYGRPDPRVDELLHGKHL